MPPCLIANRLTAYSDTDRIHVPLIVSHNRCTGSIKQWKIIWRWLQPLGLTEAKELSNFCFNYTSRQSRALFHSNRYFNLKLYQHKFRSIAMPFFNQRENVQKQKPVYVHEYVARYAYIRNLANLARLVKKVRLQPCYVQEYPIFVSLKTPAKKDNKQLFD